MRSKRSAALPARVERARERFASWRRRRSRRAIPDELWTCAVKVAAEHGIHRTARALRLNYDSLRKRVESAPPTRPGGGKEPTTFIELVPGGAGHPSECLIEMESEEGAKMRIHVRGGEVPDVVALAESFWNGEA